MNSPYRIYALLLLLCLFACTEDSLPPEGHIPEDLTYKGDIHISSQEELNEFGAFGYEKVEGRLLIYHDEEASGDAINDLSPLKSLKEVKNLEIRDLSNLDNLDGIENITSIESLHLIRLTNLTSMEGFPKVTSIAWLQIDSLPALQGMNEILNLKEIGYLSLTGTLNNNLNFNQLEVLGGLSTTYLNKEISFPLIEKIDKLTIYESTSTGLVDLPEVTSMEETLLLSHNESIETINLPKLNKVGDALTILNTPIPLDFNGLSLLKEVDVLVIQETNTLENLDVFSHLETINEAVYFKENPDLKDYCAITAAIQASAITDGNFLIQQNQFNPTLNDLKNGNCKE